MTTWSVPAEGRYTSAYGPRTPPTPGATAFHQGQDISPWTPGERGNPVVSAGPGSVEQRTFNSARGNVIRVRHDDNSMTLYQHLDRMDVTVGQTVVTGQQVGLMGDTGVGSGVHLHFECFNPGVNAYIWENATDPVPFMAARGVSLSQGTPITTGPTTPEDWLMALTDSEQREILTLARYLNKNREGDLFMKEIPSRTADAILAKGLGQNVGNVRSALEDTRVISRRTELAVLALAGTTASGQLASEADAEAVAKAVAEAIPDDIATQVASHLANR